MEERNEEVQETPEGQEPSEQPEPSEESAPASQVDEAGTADEPDIAAELIAETTPAAEPKVEDQLPSGEETEETPPQAEEAPARELVELASEARYFATGKRKSAVARVIVRPGKGAFDLNGRPLEVYFPRPRHQAVVRQPLEATGYLERVDIRARIHGGGISGQAGAVRHGIAKALIEVDPNLRGELKRRQFLTRDPREKERRKAGLKKARKRPQFSKR